MTAIDSASESHSDDQLGRRLARLRLSVDCLAEARGLAQADVDQCTDLDPPGFRGAVRTARTMRYLREALIPLGWTPDDSGNQPSVVSPDGRIGIVCTSGDLATGLDYARPKTKYPKGEVTQRRVRANRQLSLFDTEAADSEVVAGEERTTWLLLQCPAGDTVRAELSCPDGFDNTGRVDSWSERLILPDLEIDAYETWVPEDGDDDGALDVPVHPR